MKVVVSQKHAGRRHPRGTLDFAPIADRFRMPWRFLAQHISVDGLSTG